MFRSVLIANRGEIACRIARTCRRLGVKSIAVYSEADARAPHVAAADEAVALGAPPVRDSYGNLSALSAAIRSSGAEAVHPGYGLLSESPELARAVAEAGAVFVGPPPDVLTRVGDKIEARRLARSLGVQPPPGSEAAVEVGDAAALEQTARALGLPLMVKAAAGGGGIGMSIVRDLSELERAARTCADRARQAFGDGRVFLERYLGEPRHVEVQILADAAGAVTTLGERECSVQRRHQKIVEEAPSPAACFDGVSGAERRARLADAAAALAETVGYVGAGTVEFVLDAAGEPYFLEVNARLQVEHAVTEMTWQLDLVEEQLRIAAGEPLSSAVRSARPHGHALEARIYAEDPARGYLPQPGRVERFRPPSGEHVRVDAGISEGYEVTSHYDPLLAKVIAWGANREEARLRLDRALAETELVLVGPKGPRATNLPLLRRALANPGFMNGQYDTGLLERM